MENRGGRGEEQSSNSLSLSPLFLPPFPPILLFLSCYGVISCKALLSRCGNFIFTTNLQPPSLSPHSSCPLVDSSSVLSLSTSARARVHPCSPLASSPSRKFTLNVQFHLRRSHPSTAFRPLPKRVVSSGTYCAMLYPELTDSIASFKSYRLKFIDSRI